MLTPLQKRSARRVHAREFRLIRTNGRAYHSNGMRRGKQLGKMAIFTRDRMEMRARARAARRGNIINFHGCVVITIIKFPRGPRPAARGPLYRRGLLRAERLPLSLAETVPDTDLQVLLIESNAGRVFGTLNEWRIARLRCISPGTMLAEETIIEHFLSPTGPDFQRLRSFGLFSLERRSSGQELVQASRGVELLLVSGDGSGHFNEIEFVRVHSKKHRRRKILLLCRYVRPCETHYCVLGKISTRAYKINGDIH